MFGIVGFVFCLLGLSEFLSSSSDEESVGDDVPNSLDKPLLSSIGIRTPSPLVRRTSRSTSASEEVLRKRFDS